MSYSYDIAVIGAGPAGYEAALKLADAGKKVILAEKDNFGGVCTNCGCIPTKALLNCAKTFYHAKEGEKYGVHCNPVFSLSQAMNLKTETVETLRNSIGKLLETAGVTVVIGKVAFTNSHSFTVNNETYDADTIILATGSRPMMVPIQGINDYPDRILDSTKVLELENLPSSIVIIGGGVIGIEFASFFSMLGVKVSVVEMMEDILPMLDTELAKIVRREMKEVSFYLNSSVNEITANSVKITDSKQKLLELECDKVLVATGRMPNTECVQALNLEKSGRYIKVDNHMKTSLPNIYAIGDVTGLSLLAHSASKMAETAVADILGEDVSFNPVNVPWAVYSLPEVSGCGLTEKKATDLGYQVKTSSQIMRSNGRFLAENTKRSSGVVKVVAEEKTNRILGIFIVGPYASEMIWGASLAIGKNMTCKEIADTVFPHPSISEVIKSACLL